MRVTNLKKLIQECIKEVLLELDQDYSTTGITKISKDDPLKQQKIQNAQKTKKSYELYEKNIEEMARIPQLYGLGENADKITDPKLKNSATVQGWLEYIRNNGPSSVINVAKNAFDTPKRQQQLNPLVQPLIDLGILEPAGLAAEPKTKSIKGPKQQKFGDEGEELFSDESDEKGVEDEFVGFARNYGKKGWKPRDGDEEEETGEIFNDIPEPSSDEIEDLDKYFDDFDDEDDLDENTKKQMQIRAGIKK